MEAKVNNTLEQRRLRRSQSTLVIVGTGIIIFGAWAALKVYSAILLGTENTIAEFRVTVIDESDPISDSDLLKWIIIFATIYVLIELSVRVYVGRSAISEGRGTASGRLYLVLTFILILAALAAVLLDVLVVLNDIAGKSTEGEVTRQDAWTSLVIDLTSLVMMVQMMISAFRVRKYKKTHRETEAGNAA